MPQNSLLIHIGLPKTATTSIQKHVFSRELGSGWIYAGVNQPRGIEQTGLYNSIMEVLTCRANEVDQATDNFRTNFSKFTSGTKSVLISEEMITVDQKGITWQEKLHRLAAVTSQLNTKILVTVRSPVPGMFSLFIEQWHAKNKELSFDEYFEVSNQAKIYRYDYLFNLLHSLFDPQAIQVIQFELIKMDRRFIEELESALDVKIGIQELPLVNSTKRDSGNVLTDGTQFSEWLRSIHAYLPTKLGNSTKAMLRPFASLVQSKRIPGTEKSFTPPDYETLNKRLLESNIWFRNEYGIDYVSYNK